VANSLFVLPLFCLIQSALGGQGNILSSLTDKIFLASQKELARIIELRQDQKPFLTNLVNNPELTYSYELNLLEGRVYLNLQQYKQAYNNFKKGLQLANSDLEKSLALYYLGRTFLLEGSFDSATKYFGEVLEHNPNPSSDFLYDYGIALYKLGRDADAFSALFNLYQQLQFISSAPSDELLTLLGLLALKTGKTNQAILFLEPRLLPQRRCSIPEAYYILALAYYQDNQLQKAESLLKETEELPCPLTIRQKNRVLLGTVQQEQNKYELALKTFTQIIQDTIQIYQDYAYLNAGFIHYQKKRYEDAINYFTALAKKFPDSELMEYGLYYMVKIYRKLKRNRLAIEKNRELATKFPKSKFLETTILDIAKLYYKERSFANAFRELNNYLKLFPKSRHRPEALYLTAVNALEIKEDSLAQVLLKQLVDSFPETPYLREAYYRLGTIELARHKFEMAKNNFLKVDSGRFYPYSLKGIGDAYLGLARYDSAELYYQNAESLLTGENGANYKFEPVSDSLMAEIRFGKETAKLKAGKHSSYIEMIKYFLAHYPPSYLGPRLQFEIGLYNYERGNYGEAIKEFYKVFNYIPDEPTVAKTHLFIARCYLNLNQMENAIKTFHYLIITSSDTVSVILALNSLAEIYTQNLAYDSAINCYLRIVEDYPSTKDAQNSLLNIARLYRKLGKNTEAKITLDRLLKESPKSEIQRPAYLEMIDLLITEGNLSYAETVAEHFTQKYGTEPLITLRLGKIKNEQNRFEEAKTLFLAASQGLEGDEKAEALILTSEVLIKMNDTTEAKNCLKNAITIAENERLKIKCQELLRILR